MPLIFTGKGVEGPDLTGIPIERKDADLHHADSLLAKQNCAVRPIARVSARGGDGREAFVRFPWPLGQGHFFIKFMIVSGASFRSKRRYLVGFTIVLWEAC